MDAVAIVFGAALVVSFIWIVGIAPLRKDMKMVMNATVKLMAESPSLKTYVLQAKDAERKRDDG